MTIDPRRADVERLLGLLSVATGSVMLFAGSPMQVLTELLGRWGSHHLWGTLFVLIGFITASASCLTSIRLRMFALTLNTALWTMVMGVLYSSRVIIVLSAIAPVIVAYSGLCVWRLYRRET